MGCRVEEEEEEGRSHTSSGGERGKKSPIEQLKRGCFALLARHNETACGRRVYTPSSQSRWVWERRNEWEGR